MKVRGIKNNVVTLHAWWTSLPWPWRRFVETAAWAWGRVPAGLVDYLRSGAMSTDRAVTLSRVSIDRVIEDCALDALAAGDGPDDRARNAIESSRDWRAPARRRRARFSRHHAPSPSTSRRFP